MREKKLRLITTFHTTADAIACEKVCMAENIAGRMIPVPRQLSAGCGLAWCSEPGTGEELSTVLKEKNIDFEDMQEIMF